MQVVGGKQRQIVRLVGLGLGFIGLISAVHGFTPHPAVSPGGSRVLIQTNNALRAEGPAAIGCLVILISTGMFVRRRSALVDAQVRSTHQPLAAALSAVGLTAVLIATTGAASGLGQAAAEGAFAPVAIANGAANPHDRNPLVVTEQAQALPFSNSQIERRNADLLAQRLRATGAEVTPYTLVLGDLRVIGRTSSPSSGAIVVLPGDTIRRLPSTKAMPSYAGVGAADCNHQPVVVNGQLGVGLGKSVLLDGHTFPVAGVLKAYPGLDRATAFLSLETARRCMFATNGYTGLLISNARQDRVEAAVKNMSEVWFVQDFKSYRNKYASFWQHSVQPPEMQFVLYLWLTSLVGLAAIRTAAIQRRKQFVATQIAGGVSKKTLITAEAIRSALDLYYALLAGGPIMLILITVNASSQYGLQEAFDMRALGAGTLVGVAASVVGTLSCQVYIRRFDDLAAERQ